MFQNILLKIIYKFVQYSPYSHNQYWRNPDVIIKLGEKLDIQLDTFNDNPK
jgi:hypothetical protein